MANIQLPMLEFRDYQKPLWNYMMRERPGLRSLCVWPRRNGKDLTHINILAAKALQRKGLYLYIAPFANQVRSIIWEGSDGTGKRFRDYIPTELTTRVLDQQMKLWLSNGSLIQLCGSDNPDAIVGTNPMGIIFTEYSLHKDQIWQYMRPVLAENGGWAMFNGTPRGMNHMYTMAQRAQNDPAWFYEKLTAADTGFPSLEDIEKERKDGMPESLIEQEFYTSWTSSSEETLIPLDKLEICLATHLHPQTYLHSPRIMGIDPAYAEKGDRAVIVQRQGLKVHHPWVTRGMDPMALASEAARQIEEFRPHVVYVDAGRGEAIWSRLHQLGYDQIVIPVHFGGKTYSDLYHRKKDEIWGRMKNALCHPYTPVDLPDSPELIKDLSAPTFTLNEYNKLVVESKTSLKARGFSSTDLGDALALTYAEEDPPVPHVSERQRRLGLTPELIQQLDDMSQPEYNMSSYLGDMHERFSARWKD